MYKIYQCESYYGEQLRHVNKECEGKYKNSVDRGFFQINNVSHPEVSDKCADDEVCSANAAVKIFNKRGLNEWACASIVKDKPFPLKK